MNWRHVWDALVCGTLIGLLLVTLWCVRRCGTLTRDNVEAVSPFMQESRRIDNDHARQINDIERCLSAIQQEMLRRGWTPPDSELTTNAKIVEAKP